MPSHLCLAGEQCTGSYYTQNLDFLIQGSDRHSSFVLFDSELNNLKLPMFKHTSENLEARLEPVIIYLDCYFDWTASFIEGMKTAMILSCFIETVSIDDTETGKKCMMLRAISKTTTNQQRWIYREVLKVVNGREETHIVFD
jgi:hypothetical protein